MTDAGPSLGGMALIGVVGAGTRGAGIAQVALEHGHEVELYDVDDAATERGRARIGDGLRRRAAAVEPDEGEAAWIEARLANLRFVISLEDLALGADVVIEAALDDLDLKRTIFRTLDAAARPDVPLATTASALSVADIADATNWPDRVLGLHFVDPAPDTRLVEVVAAPRSDRHVVEVAADLMTRWDRVPVVVADAPGFILNRLSRPFTLEALRLLEAGAGTVEAIDAAIEAAGYPMGPFARLDLVGVDVDLAASIALFDRLGNPAHLRPSPIQVALVEAGRLGRRGGSGFYAYNGPDRVAAEPLGWPPPGSRSPAHLDAAQIVERIERAISHEAVRAAADGVASEGDIDIAMRLGANHPEGPFERVRRPR